MNSKKKKKKQTFKVQSRINNSKNEDIKLVIIDKFVKDYESTVVKIKDPKLKEEYIINESNEILEQLNISDNIELLHKYEAWQIIMENLLINSYNSDLKYIYPDYYDNDFNTKIYNKNEFRLNKIPKRKEFKSLEEEELYSQKLCNPSKDKNFNRSSCIY